MLQLLIGLTLFLGIHSLHSLAPQLRQNAFDRWGALGFKGVYSAVSLLGFVLLIQGYAQARMDPVVLWTPSTGMTHATLALMWLAMVLLVASYVPGNRIRARLRHPMTLSVKVWALAHLLCNGQLADVLLFGSFLVWAVLVFRAARQRDLSGLSSRPRVRPWATWVVLGVGTGIWLAFWAGDVHLWLIGVRPIALPVAA
jgi:uncharacterized membrane protein